MRLKIWLMHVASLEAVASQLAKSGRERLVDVIIAPKVAIWPRTARHLNETGPKQGRLRYIQSLEKDTNRRGGNKYFSKVYSVWYKRSSSTLRADDIETINSTKPP